MDSFIVNGGKILKGEITISGSKNAALPIIIATMLTKESSVIFNVPDLRDIKSTLELLNYMGKDCDFVDNNFSVAEPGHLKHHAPYDLVRKMRASMLVTGPLLARYKKVRFSMPGGCTIGLRPIDIHIEAFKKLGAEVSYEQGDVILTANKLKPARIKFRFPSVGATENLMMCASLISGKTTLENCAREPEIEDLAKALRSMGAFVEGEGSPVIRITGVRELKGLHYSVMPDRIETGTFMLAAAACGGTLKLLNTNSAMMLPVTKAMQKAGVKIEAEANSIKIISEGARPKPVNIITKPHPGFPTDLQAPWMAFMARVKGKCEVREEIFENRFMHAAELNRMGANITLHERKAVIKGVDSLLGAPIMASDIRAGAALLVAAAMAKGKSVIRRVYHIDRGYEGVEVKLRQAGVNITRNK